MYNDSVSVQTQQTILFQPLSIQPFIILNNNHRYPKRAFYNHNRRLNARSCHISSSIVTSGPNRKGGSEPNLSRILYVILWGRVREATKKAHKPTNSPHIPLPPHITVPISSPTIPSPTLLLTPHISLTSATTTINTVRHTTNTMSTTPTTKSHTYHFNLPPQSLSSRTTIKDIGPHGP